MHNDPPFNCHPRGFDSQMLFKPLAVGSILAPGTRKKVLLGRRGIHSRNIIKRDLFGVLIKKDVVVDCSALAFAKNLLLGWVVAQSGLVGVWRYERGTRALKDTESRSDGLRPPCKSVTHKDGENLNSRIWMSRRAL